ncbi:MAG: lipopolysaccharide kinase InaA family protein [Planctomycetia bacterium]
MPEPQPVLDIRRAYGVPDGVRLKVDAREVLAWLPGFEVAVRQVAAGPEGLPEAALGGRRRLRRIVCDEGRLLVREYGKGGALRALRPRLFHGRWRPLDELVLQRRLLALGVPVAEAVGCVVLRRAGGWRGFLLLREVEPACDLEAVLYGQPAPGHVARARLLERAGAAVRRLHDAGVPHPDLHPKNLLVAGDGRVLVLDMDRAQGSEGLLAEEVRLANLVRLGRWVEKHRLKGLQSGRRDALRFLAGYAGGREAAARWLEAVRTRLAPGLALRQLWWRLRGEARPYRAAAGSGPA